jgi:hypothetical protein
VRKIKWIMGIGDWAQSPIPNPHINKEKVDNFITDLKVEVKKLK